MLTTSSTMVASSGGLSFPQRPVNRGNPCDLSHPADGANREAADGRPDARLTTSSRRRLR